MFYNFMSLFGQLIFHCIYIPVICQCTFGSVQFSRSAKSLLQSCPTLCNPMDSSPPGSSSLGFSRQEQGVGCHFLLQCMKVKSESEVCQSCPILCEPMASLSITNSRSLLKLTSIELVRPSNHLILCHPLLLLPSIFASISVFSHESVLRIRWPKYWSFSFSISPSNEYSGLISFRMDWLDLLAVQGTLKSLLQHHSSKA